MQTIRITVDHTTCEVHAFDADTREPITTYRPPTGLVPDVVRLDGIRTADGRVRFQVVTTSRTSRVLDWETDVSLALEGRSLSVLIPDTPRKLAAVFG